MTEPAALQIILDRRGTMYDPVVVDAFAASYRRIMPSTDSARHPAAQLVGAARSMDREEPRALPAVATDGGLSDGLLAVTSLSRAVGGGARIADVGALMWMVVRQVLPCDAMAIFLPDEGTDHVTVRFAAGAHAAALRGVSRARGTGIAGWVAVNRQPALNADPSLDLGIGGAELAPGLRSCLAMPLAEGEALTAVLTLYRDQPGAFSDDDVRLVELLAPRLASSLVEAARNDQSVPHLSPAVVPLKLVRTVASA
jgi:GAF domain-containing protein